MKNLSPIINGLIPGLPERGKIKIGMKGAKRTTQNGKTFQLPQKIDHFIVTTLERDNDDNFKKDVEIHKELSPKPKELPIRLLYDDITLNFQCRYACYKGRELFCQGDGAKAYRIEQNKKYTERECPCERVLPDYDGEGGNGKGACKINGSLSVLIDCKSASIGGVWKYRTTGYNSTTGILGSLQLIHGITGGLLAGIPLTLTVTPKVAPVNGKSQTIYVVGIIYKGSVESLRQISLDCAQKSANHYARMQQVEITAKKMISYEKSLVDEASDIVEEFHPDELIEEIKDPETSEPETNDQEKEEPKEVEVPKKQAKKSGKAPKAVKTNPKPENSNPVEPELQIESTQDTDLHTQQLGRATREEPGKQIEIEDEPQQEELDFEF
jgi:hypothetical protein